MKTIHSVFLVIKLVWHITDHVRYRKDNNKTPAESILLPITTHLCHFLNKVACRSNIRTFHFFFKACNIVQNQQSCWTDGFHVWIFVHNSGSQNCKREMQGSGGVPWANSNSCWEKLLKPCIRWKLCKSIVSGESCAKSYNHNFLLYRMTSSQRRRCTITGWLWQKER